jgi:CRP-like cAMP-binding protein
VQNNDNNLTAIPNILKQFAAVPEEQVSIFSALLRPVSYQRHEYFVKAGEAQTQVGYVLNGLFRLFYIDQNGKEYTKNFFVPGHFVAPYNSILKGEPSNLYIQALTDSEVLSFDYNKAIELIDLHPCWQTVFRKITESAYLQKEKRESDLLFYDAKTRYQNFINEIPNALEHIKQHHIASFLGMSPETLSRIKKSLIS